MRKMAFFYIYVEKPLSGNAPGLLKLRRLAARGIWPLARFRCVLETKFSVRFVQKLVFASANGPGRPKWGFDG